MPTTSWNVTGQYYETCSCDFVCPCILTQMSATPTGGACTFAMAFAIDRGSYDGLTLDGLGFVVLGLTPEAMGKGNWTVGVIVDERASASQREALTAIASGQGGGPMAALGPLVGRFAGTESRPITIEQAGMRRAVSIPGVLDFAVEGIPGARPDEPIYFDNVGHPAASRLALAKASRSHMHAFGIDWDDTSGRNNGHFAPFAWSSS